MNTQDAAATSSSGEAARTSWWRKLLKHPVFPLLVFLVLTQVIRENYPFSHYPMYADPSDNPLPFQYLADANGNPLPVLWHTGVTPSKLVKKFGNLRSEFHKADVKLAAKENREPRPESSFKEQAGRETLLFLRQQSLRRAEHRQLPEDVILMETILSYVDNDIVETTNVVGRLH